MLTKKKKKKREPGIQASKRKDILNQEAESLLLAKLQLDIDL